MKLNEIFLLFRVQLLGFFGANQAQKTRGKQKRKKPRGFAYMAAISSLALLYFSAQYSIMIVSAIKESAISPKILPLFMSFSCCMMVLVSTLLKASPTLFGAGDTDILMSLPVNNSSIIASRVLVLYYTVHFHPPAAGVVLFVFLFFITPLLPCVLGGLLGTAVEILTAKLGRSALLRNAISILFLVAVMASSFLLSGSAPGQMAASFEKITSKAAAVYPPLQWMADAFCDGSFLKFLLFTGVSLAAFALFSLLVGFRFKALIGLVTGRKTGRGYKLSAAKTGSPFRALYRKELKRFFTSNVYFMNFGVGMIIAVLSTAAAVVFRANLLELAGRTALLRRALPFSLGLFVCMSATTACSISLEGRRFALLRSLPIDAKDILRSKLAVNLTVSGAPAVVCGAVLAVTLRMEPLEACAAVLLPALYAALSAVLGLMANLRHPMMDWKAEITPVKQSAATFIAVVGFMPLSIVPALVVMALAPFYSLVMPVLMAVLAAVSLLFYRSLMQHAEQKMRAIPL